MTEEWICMCRWIAVISWLACNVAWSQTSFTIQWREVAQVQTSAAGEPAVVKPLAAKSPSQASEAKVERIAIEPAVLRTGRGKIVCLSRFDIAAYGPAGERTASVPLELHMQEQHLRTLTFESKPKDLCFRVTQTGELAIRLTSKIPARDGTYRGAQAFVRVGD